MNETEQNNKASENLVMHRRRRHYIDASVQGRLFVAMIGLEMVLFAGSLIWLYQDLSIVIEQNLYRVHYSSGDSLASLLVVLGKIIPAIILLNIVALWLADIVWRNYIRSITRALEKFVRGAAKLDFREIPVDSGIEHEVINKAHLWQQHERQHYRSIQKAVNILPVELTQINDNISKQADESLLHLKQLL